MRDLAEKFWHGEARPDQLTPLVAARRWKRIWVVFVNRWLRALAALNDYADMCAQRPAVGGARNPDWIAVIVHDVKNLQMPQRLANAFIAKLVLATTAKDGGLAPPFRAGQWGRFGKGRRW